MDLLAVSWVGDRFVAVGDEGVVVTSGDGTTWTVPEPATGHRWTRVVWAGGRFVAWAPGAMTTSVDGVSWSRNATNLSLSMNDVVWTGSQFVAAASGAILTSADGMEWTHRHGESVDLTGLAWTGSQFVAVGGGSIGLGRYDVVVLTSPDGVSWTPSPARASGRMYDVVTDGERYVGVGARIMAVGHDVGPAAAAIWSSVDGMQWTERFVTEREYEERLFTAAAWSGSTFVAMGPHGVMTSPDGVRWTPAEGAIVGHPSDMVWTGAEFVAVGEEETYSGRSWLARSVNGRDWTEEATGSTRTLNGIAWNGRMAVVVGDGDVIMTSCLSEPPSPPASPGRLVAPNGGEAWKIGTRQEIRWVAPDVGAHARARVAIRFSRDGGRTWRTIKRPQARAGLARWTPRRRDRTTQARMAVCSMPARRTSERACDASEADFTVYRQ